MDNSLVHMHKDCSIPGVGAAETKFPGQSAQSEQETPHSLLYLNNKLN